MLCCVMLFLITRHSGTALRMIHRMNVKPIFNAIFSHQLVANVFSLNSAHRPCNSNTTASDEVKCHQTLRPQKNLQIYFNDFLFVFCLHKIWVRALKSVLRHFPSKLEFSVLLALINNSTNTLRCQKNMSRLLAHPRISANIYHMKCLLFM